MPVPVAIPRSSTGCPLRYGGMCPALASMAAPSAANSQREGCCVARSRRQLLGFSTFSTATDPDRRPRYGSLYQKRHQHSCLKTFACNIPPATMLPLEVCETIWKKSPHLSRRTVLAFLVFSLGGKMVSRRITRLHLLVLLHIKLHQTAAAVRSSSCRRSKLQRCIIAIRLIGSPA